MNGEGAKGDVIRYWLEKADEAMASAQDELVAGRYAFAVNRGYYACFYALSSVLLKENHTFVKHSGVRRGLHHFYVKTGRINVEVGRFYDRLFENRQRADYQELVVFERQQVEELLSGAARFVAEMRRLLRANLAEADG